MSHLGRDAFLTQNFAAGYPGFPPLLENLNLRVQAKQRIVITGPNGSGKTTLLRTLAGEIPPLKGSIMFGASVKVGYMSQEQELLDQGKSVLETTQNLVALNETDVRSFLHHFLFTGDDVLRPVELLSYGERSRLLLAMLVLEGCNLLLLDEPINHLDIPSRERFEAALLQFDGTILAVVHDRYFIQRFATHLWLVENKQIHQDVLIA
jgi:ATP-binding cassette subfamily F protein 3